MKHLSILMAGLLVGALAGCPGTTGGDDDDSAGCDDTGVTWTDDVQPLLTGHCAGCHNEGGSGPPWLEAYDRVDRDALDDIACGAGVSRAVCILHRIDNGSMPLGAGCAVGEPGCVTAEEFALLQDWEAGCFAE